MKYSLIIALAFSFSVSSMAQFANSQECVDKTFKQIEKKNYETAFELLNQGIYEMPDSTELYDLRAQLYEAFREFDKAKMRLNGECFYINRKGERLEDVNCR